MNVLVIGSNGAVGRKVISQLKDTDYSSVALVRKKNKLMNLKT